MIVRLLIALSALAAVATACSTSQDGPAAPPSSTSTGAAPSTSAGTSEPAPSSSAPSTSLPTQSTAAAQTTRTTLRPVTAAGQPAQGYSVKAGQGSIICTDGMRSPVAVTDGVLFCSPSAAYAIACLKAAAPSTAYCLVDAESKQLVRYRLSGGFPSAHPAEFEPRPILLTLTDGTRCTLRDSGAGARLKSHPSWIEYYYCGAGDTQSVWAPADSTTAGIIKGDGLWQVRMAASDGTGALTTKNVAAASYVGAAS